MGPHAFTNSFDRLGQLRSRTYSTNRRLDWNYDLRGYLSSVRDFTGSKNYATALDWDARLQLKSWTAGNGFKQNQSFETSAPATLWRSVFEPLGIGSRAVLNANGTRQLASVLQLDVPARVPVAGLERSAPCPSCHRINHAAITRGPFPHVDLGGHHVVKTEEWFGSGASGWRAIIISGQLYRRLRDEKAKGVAFVPVADAAAPTTALITSSSR